MDRVAGNGPTPAISLGAFHLLHIRLSTHCFICLFVAGTSILIAIYLAFGFEDNSKLCLYFPEVFRGLFFAFGQRKFQAELFEIAIDMIYIYYLLSYLLKHIHDQKIQEVLRSCKSMQEIG